MISKLLRPYQGLSREVWFLALTTLVNRAGAMVIPFLSLYLTNYLGFSLGQVGWVISCFGLGSLAGVFVGGKMADRIGYYRVLKYSLIATGVVFLGLQFVKDFYLLCFGVFLLTLVADTFRPAVWVALDDYSLPKNRTRSVTLIRLAINLGFSLGPALGGLIITYVSYKGLFWVDALSCFAAAWILGRYLYQKSRVQTSQERKDRAGIPPLKDRPYLVFWVSMFLISFAFMQFFSTIPLFFSENLHLGEDTIGLIMAMNGLLIFLTEMPLVDKLENSRLDHLQIVIGGVVFLAFSFLMLNLAGGLGLAIVAMVLMTIGEMLGFPFSNAYALERSRKGSQGAYMAMYGMSFSVGHILGPNIGMQFSAAYGFDRTWYLMAFVCVLAGIILLVLRRKNPV